MIKHEMTAAGIVMNGSAVVSFEEDTAATCVAWVMEDVLKGSVYPWEGE
jgi:hypothetical protein